MSWGGGREICRRPGAAHACKTVLGAEAAVFAAMLVPRGLPLQERKRTCRAAAHLAFGCFYRLSRPSEGTRTLSLCFALDGEAPH